MKKCCLNVVVLVIILASGKFQISRYYKKEIKHLCRIEFIDKPIDELNEHVIKSDEKLLKIRIQDCDMQKTHHQKCDLCACMKCIVHTYMCS